MKRIIALLLLTLILSFALASCTSETNTSTDDKTEAVEKETEYQPIEELIDGFEDEPLVPKIMTSERFESIFVDSIINSRDRDIFCSFYVEYDIENGDYGPADIAEIEYVIPAAKENSVYVLNPDISPRELGKLQEIIEEHCEDYTHGDLAADYLLCGYNQEDIVNGEAVVRDNSYVSVPDFIKDGYTVPYVMESERFEKLCKNDLFPDAFDPIFEYYTKYDMGEGYPEDEYYSELSEKFPLIGELSVYVLSDVDEDEMAEIEDILYRYGGYSVEDLFVDYIRCGYFLDK